MVVDDNSTNKAALSTPEANDNDDDNDTRESVQAQTYRTPLKFGYSSLNSIHLLIALYWCAVTGAASTPGHERLAVIGVTSNGVHSYRSMLVLRVESKCWREDWMGILLFPTITQNSMRQLSEEQLEADIEYLKNTSGVLDTVRRASNTSDAKSTIVALASDISSNVEQILDTVKV